MMSESVFFEWLEIEGFRGFRERQRFDLAASVVVLSGPNGSGKTSFFDAIQWLLLGTLVRLEPWRARRNTEHIVNQYYHAAGKPATVSAGLQIGDSVVEIQRSGRHNGSQLEWRANGDTLLEGDADRALEEALTPQGRMSLQRSLLSSGLLQQDVIRDVLEDKPADRYQQLAAMLGLNAISDFPEAARQRASRLIQDAEQSRRHVADLEKRVLELSGRIKTLQAYAESAPDAQVLREQIADRLRRNRSVLELRNSVPINPTDAQGLRTTVRLAADAVGGLIASNDPHVAALARQASPSAKELAAVEAAVAASATALTQARAEVEAVARDLGKERDAASRVARLAADAIPLLDSDCPVCGQTIDPDHVRGHLEKAVQEGAAELTALEARHAALQERVAACEADVEEATQRAAAVRHSAEQIAVANENQRRWEGQVQQLLADLTEHFIVKDEGKLLAGDQEVLHDLKTALTDIAHGLSELVNALSDVRETAAITAAEAELADVRLALEQATKIASEASASEEEARALQRAAVRAAAAVTESRFEILRPFIQDVYDRLDPHPAFTNLEFAVDVYRERGIALPRVADPEHGLEVDPLLVFSSSQANVVALSAFLALAWAAGDDAMPFLLLDDPLQSLDDVNALGFSDVCRHLRSRRQLILSTHDRRLAALLQRKLAPRQEMERSRVLQFVAWSRSGPLVDESDIESQVDQGARRALMPTSSA